MRDAGDNAPKRRQALGFGNFPPQRISLAADLGKPSSSAVDGVGAAIEIALARGFEARQLIGAYGGRSRQTP